MEERSEKLSHDFTVLFSEEEKKNQHELLYLIADLSVVIFCWYIYVIKNVKDQPTPNPQPQP